MTIYDTYAQSIDVFCNLHDSIAALSHGFEEHLSPRKTLTHRYHYKSTGKISLFAVTRHYDYERSTHSIIQYLVDKTLTLRY